MYQANCRVPLENDGLISLVSIVLGAFCLKTTTVQTPVSVFLFVACIGEARGHGEVCAVSYFGGGDGGGWWRGILAQGRKRLSIKAKI